ncbi:MAG TPA: Smr/MutS family protein [Devosiaceae bacterium]|jgi:DNA-nicking Smr family endonuclease
MAKRGKPQSPVRDWHLWADVKRTVTPLRPEPEEPLSGEPLPLPPVEAPHVSMPRQFRVGEAAAPKPPKSPYRPKAPWESGHPIEPKLRRKLMRGQMALDATIDLHGMRQGEARAALIRFIHARINRGDRTVLVITGKGLKKLDDRATTIIERGVLRSMLPLWLSEADLAPLIAGWDVSAQSHGGEGAYYVRLKRLAP